jgi:hypothetical protein
VTALYEVSSPEYYFLATTGTNVTCHDHIFWCSSKCRTVSNSNHQSSFSRMWQHRWALWSGFLGASASCLIKMGLGSDEHSPIQYFQTQVCPKHPWMVDLDKSILSIVYLLLGDLMIKRRINLMPHFTKFRKAMESLVLQLYVFDIDYCQALTLPARLLCIVGMMFLNAYMIASFLRGMQESGSIVAPSLSTASNFTASAIYGALLWHEQMNVQWCAGFVCVLVGVMFLSNTTQIVGDDNYTKEARSDAERTTIYSIYENDSHPKALIKTSPPRLERGKVASMVTKYATKSSSETSMTPATRPKQRCKLPIPSAKSTVKPTMSIKTNKANIKSESLLRKYYNDSSSKHSRYDPRLVDNNFLNECALCEGTIFDTATGVSEFAVADLSPNTCFHIFHAKCLKQSTKFFDNTCPLCESPLAMWTSSKEAAHFPGFWLHRVEQYLLRRKDGPPHHPASGKPICLLVSTIREAFSRDSTLTPAQKVFISDDPSGMGKGLQAALEWGGYRDYNAVPKGHVGFQDCLRSKGIWTYDTKKDEIWLWSWGHVHPQQRCDQCQLIKRPLPVVCQDCVGSSKAAMYCSNTCSKRDWQRHKQICQQWTAYGPTIPR